MIKIFIRALKKIVAAFALLYSFNILVSSLNIIIPINYISLSIVSILGIPGMLSMLAIRLIIF